MITAQVQQQPVGHGAPDPVRPPVQPGLLDRGELVSGVQVKLAEQLGVGAPGDHPRGQPELILGEQLAHQQAPEAVIELAGAEGHRGIPRDQPPDRAAGSLVHRVGGRASRDQPVGADLY